MESSPLTSRKPNMHMIGPIWFHHHGIKIRVASPDPVDPPQELLKLVASAASLTIEKQLDGTNCPWLLRWKVIQSRSEEVSGTVRMSTEVLRAAFGLDVLVTCFSAWMIDRFGGDSAVQGLFIRWQDFLNIPGPGTGHDGDPNISIQLDDEIKEAVLKMIEESE